MPHEMPQSVDARLHQWPAVLRLSAAWTIGILTVTLMPIEISAFMRRLLVSEDTASLIAGLQLVGVVMACLVLPRRISHLRTASLALGLVVLGGLQMASASVGNLVVLGAMRIGVGFCEGSMIVLVGTCLARHGNAELLWGKIVFISGILSAGTFTLLASMSQTLQLHAVWYVVAGTELLLSLSIPGLLPLARQNLAAAPVLSATRAGRRTATAYAILALLYMVQAGQWAVTVLAGERQGLPTGLVEVLLAISSFAGLLGAAVTALRALRARQRTVSLLSVLCMAGCVLWFFTVPGRNHFFFSQVALNFAFYAVTPLMNACVSEADRDGSLLARAVVIVFIASAIGTVGAGAISSAWGLPAVGLAGAGLLALSNPLIVGLFRRVPRRRAADDGADLMFSP